MEVCNSPDIFQENISEIFEGFDMILAYVDNLMVITKYDFVEYLNAL